MRHTVALVAGLAAGLACTAATAPARPARSDQRSASVGVAHGGAGKGCQNCSYAGSCLAGGACACFSGWTGPTCAMLDNQTVPVSSGFRLPDYHVWGSQVLGPLEDGRFHMIASIYPKALDFDKHWLTNSQNAYAVADTAEGPFSLVSIVMPYRDNATKGAHAAPVAEPWDRSVDNPKLVRAADGTFLLYYTGDTFNGTRPTPSDPNPFNTMIAQADQRIGLAHASSVGGPYTRLPAPVLEPRRGKWDDRMVTNPAVLALPNGTLLMVYKASSPPGAGARQKRVCLGVARADHWAGPYTRLRDDPIFPCPDDSFYFEDPCVWADPSGVFHLVVKDFKGQVTHAGYSGAHAWSTDFVNWHWAAPNPLTYTTTHRWSDGKVRHQYRQERPQVLLGADGQPSHAYFATDTGLDGVRDGEFWNMVVPLRATRAQ